MANKFIRADKLPLPDMENFHKQRLFRELQDHYGKTDWYGFSEGDLDPSRPYAISDELGFPTELPAGLSKDGFADNSLRVSDFVDEPLLNDYSKRMANAAYDANQPYGFDFSEDAERGLVDNMDGRHYYVDPDGSVTYNGDVFNGAWESESPVPQPNEEGFIGEAKNALMPIARTAGSYALPMLFSMLMRGGK